jgi:hypothetical protein
MSVSLLLLAALLGTGSPLATCDKIHDHDLRALCKRDCDAVRDHEARAWCKTDHGVPAPVHQPKSSQ